MFSVTRLGDLLDFGQLFKAFGNMFFTFNAQYLRKKLSSSLQSSCLVIKSSYVINKGSHLVTESFRKSAPKSWAKYANEVMQVVVAVANKVNGLESASISSQKHFSYLWK